MVYFKLQSLTTKWKINFNSELNIEGLFVGQNWSPIQEVKISCGKQRQFCKKEKYQVEIDNEKKTGLYKFSKKIFPQTVFSVVKIKVYAANETYQKKLFVIQLRKRKNNTIEPQGLIYSNLGCYDSKKQNLLLCVHEISLSGAPIIGLKLAQQLFETYNIILWIGKIIDKEVLIKQFQQCCFKIYLGLENHHSITELQQQTPVQFAILNSIVNAPILPALKNENIKTILLIHEYAYFIRQHVRTFSFELADAIVMPAASVKESYEETQTFPQDKIFVRPQGFIEAKNRGSYCVQQLQSLQKFSGKIVLSCGTISERKGFDLFLQTAHRYQQLFPNKQTLFVWLGPEPLPNFVNWYNVYQDYITMKNVCILPPQENVEPFFQEADVFYMSSRLDPCPNVVIEAMYYSLPVVLFDKGCGCTQFFPEDTGAKIVPYLDTQTAAQQINNLLIDENLRDKMGSYNSTYVDKKLKFEDYVSDILKIAKSL
ncbi:glycosyltransferase family 4 protein [Candidatus Uabimicrobium sp. HlEnr_7]|uniref:glycosyltransferase family 4 protein n=1 Tax=Candidatus Uabimicrobium helgolandensis TaxID=3095367 RepID=UPI0035580586